MTPVHACFTHPHAYRLKPALAAQDGGRSTAAGAALGGPEAALTRGSDRMGAASACGRSAYALRSVCGCLQRVRLSTSAEQAAAVAIVGAGPTGLTLSALLSQYGVPSVLLERSAALPAHPQVSPGR